MVTMTNNINMDDLFNDTWDLSMSTIIDIVNENQINKSVRSLPNDPNLFSTDLTFFGLTNYVKNLILKYKGIETLYGKK